LDVSKKVIVLISIDNRSTTTHMTKGHMPIVNGSRAGCLLMRENQRMTEIFITSSLFTSGLLLLIVLSGYGVARFFCWLMDDKS
jgi:hypothetical protein